MVSGESSWSKKAVFAGVFVAALIAIMRYGVYHSIDVTAYNPETFAVMNILGIALDLFIVLAGLLCGYIIAATASGAKPIRGVFRDTMLAGAIAGLINCLAMVLIYYPQVPDRLSYDILNLGLYSVWYFVLIVLLSLAGRAIYSALIRKPRRFAYRGWLAGVEVGVIAAVAVMLAYYAQSLAMETYLGLTINGSYDSLIIQFIVDSFVLIAGVAAGLVTAVMVRQSVSAGADFVLSTALAGLIAGFFGIMASVLFNLGAPGHLYLSVINGLDWLNIALQIIYGAALLMTMAVSGAVIYALFHGETKLLSAEPEGPAK